MKAVKFCVSFVILLLISCNGNYVKKIFHKDKVKIGKFNWYFNGVSFEKALVEAKKSDKLILAVFSSRG